MSEPMTEIIAGLLLYIQSQLGLVNPIEPPHVEFMPAVEIAEIACAQNCGEVKGWTPPGDTVYLNQDLRITHDKFDRSIILHELVHYTQFKYQLINRSNDCLSWKEREAQAYQIQSLWLREHNIKSHSLRLNKSIRSVQFVRCPPQAADGRVANL